MMTPQKNAYSAPHTAHFSFGYISARLGNLLDRRQVSSELILIGTAVLVGIGAGLGAVVFRYLILAVGWVGYDLIPRLTENWGRAYVILVPALGGLLVGLLVYYFAREAKGHGVPEVMEAVALKGGRIRPIVAVIKSLASSLSIGSGGSVGREGPIVQIGSALGSSLGQMLHLSDDCILISIRRDGRVLIPHGDSTFEPGDHITAFIRSQDAEALHHCLRGEPELFSGDEADTIKRSKDGFGPPQI